MIKFGLSHAVLCGNVAHIFVRGNGIVSEATFELHGNSNKFELSRNLSWEKVVFIHPKIDREDESAIKQAVKREIDLVNIDSPEIIKRTFQDSPKESFFEAGWRYRFQSVVKRFEVNDGLSFGYSFNDGVAVQASYKREQADLDPLREYFGQRALTEQRTAARRALDLVNVPEISAGERVTLCKDGDWTLIKVGDAYFTILNSRSDATLYQWRVDGLNEYVVDVTTYGKIDLADEAVAHFLAVWECSDWQSTLK